MSTLDLIEEARELPKTIGRLIDALESSEARCRAAWEKTHEINADRNNGWLCTRCRPAGYPVDGLCYHVLTVGGASQ